MEGFEAQVSARAREFDLRALLSLLRVHGYGSYDVLFRSNTDASSPRSLIEAVEFPRDRGENLAIVTLNIGLLGSQPLVPSYFTQALQAGHAKSLHEPEPEDAFIDFVRFFDDRLLSGLVFAVRPELDTAIFHDWSASKTQAAHVAGLASPVALHAVAKSLYPEFEVRISHARIEQITSTHGAQVGASQLNGSSVLGRIYETSPTGFAIDLVVEDETDDYQRYWVTVARERLRQTLLPQLAAHRIPLVVRLTILAHERWVFVDGPEAEDRQRGDLGSERIRGRVGEHTIVLYRGDTSRGETQALEDLAQSHFPEFGVRVTALGTYGADECGDLWPAAFCISLVSEQPLGSLGPKQRLISELVGERLVRELMPAARELCPGMPIVVALELVRPAIGYPRSEVLVRDFQGGHER